MKGITTELAKHGPDAECASGCGWHIWAGPGSSMTRDEVYREARRHARDGRCAVEVTTTQVIRYEPEAEA